MSSAITVRPLRTSDREASGAMWRGFLGSHDAALPETLSGRSRAPEGKAAPRPGPVRIEGAAGRTESGCAA